MANRPVGWALPATTKKSLFYRWCAVPTLWLLGMVEDSHEFRAQQTMKILLPHSPLPTPHFQDRCQITYSSKISYPHPRSSFHDPSEPESPAT